LNKLRTIEAENPKKVNS